MGYRIDDGAWRMLATGDATARATVAHFLDALDHRSQHGVTLRGWHLGVAGLEELALSYRSDDRIRDRIVSTAAFADGSTWRRGSLRIKGIELPAALMSGIKGRRLGDLVGGAPFFADYPIRHAVHDRSSAGVTLRIRCDGEELRDMDDLPGLGRR